MKQELSITEIAARLQVSERTALRRIADGKLSAKRVGQSRYVIQTEDIEALAPKQKLASLERRIAQLEEGLQGVPDQGSLSGPEITAQGKIIEALRQELEDLRNRVATLEQGHKASISEHRADLPTPTPRQRTKSATTSTRPDLPASWSSWTPFIERHNVNAESRRLQKEINRADYCEPGEYMQPSTHGKTLVKCALSPTGQQALLQAIEKLDIGRELKQCEVSDCPCHQLLTKTLWS